jgi:hypothetical protein
MWVKMRRDISYLRCKCTGSFLKSKKNSPKWHTDLEFTWKKWWQVVPPRDAGDAGGSAFGEEKYSCVHIVEWK